MTNVRTNNVFVLAAVMLLLALCLVPNVAFAVNNMERLNAAYADALRGYEEALDEQDQNATEIAETEQAIEQAEQARQKAQGELNETAVALYKDTRSKSVLLDLIFSSESFQEVVIRYDLYEKVERRCADRISELAAQRDALTMQKIELEVQKAEIEAKVERARQETEEAKQALLQASHTDGAKYHQVQGNGSNCGATSFTVGLNILLHEKRYKNNVKVWEGPGFECDSTNNLAARAEVWLKANDLDDEIGIEEVKGDVHETDELKELLEDGNVVIISSGDGSPWMHAKGKKAPEGTHPYGHWVVFYNYSNGKFYCNDSSVEKARGAGIAYNEKQMQAWLDGRENHFATIMYVK